MFRVNRWRSIFSLATMSLMWEFADLGSYGCQSVCAAQHAHRAGVAAFDLGLDGLGRQTRATTRCAGGRVLFHPGRRHAPDRAAGRERDGSCRNRPGGDDPGGNDIADAFPRHLVFGRPDALGRIRNPGDALVRPALPAERGHAGTGVRDGLRDGGGLALDGRSPRGPSGGGLSLGRRPQTLPNRGGRPAGGIGDRGGRQPGHGVQSHRQHDQLPRPDGPRGNQSDSRSVPHFAGHR